MNVAMKNHLGNNDKKPDNFQQSMQYTDGLKYKRNENTESSNISISDFVLQEAREKTFEIQVILLKNFEREKSNFYDKQYSKIVEDYDK